MIIAESLNQENPARSPITYGTFAMMQGDYRLIWYTGYPSYDDISELYNMKTDPEELQDLSRIYADILCFMMNELKMKLASADRHYKINGYLWSFYLSQSQLMSPVHRFRLGCFCSKPRATFITEAKAVTGSEGKRK